MQTALTEDERRAISRKARSATLDALRALGGEARREDVRRHALEHGGFTRRELSAPPPANCRDGHATLVECRLSWAPTNLKREGLLENPRWMVWRLVEPGRSWPEPAVEQRISEDRLVELRTMPYEAYLATPEWQHTRRAMLHRANGHCQFDARHAGRLEVHHNCYDRRGVELVSDLIVLCADCHGRHHEEGPTEPVVVPLEWACPPVRPSLGAVLKRLFAH